MNLIICIILIVLMGFDTARLYLDSPTSEPTEYREIGHSQYLIGLQPTSEPTVFFAGVKSDDQSPPGPADGNPSNVEPTSEPTVFAGVKTTDQSPPGPSDGNPSNGEPNPEEPSNPEESGEGSQPPGAPSNPEEPSIPASPTSEPTMYTFTETPGQSGEGEPSNPGESAEGSQPVSNPEAPGAVYSPTSEPTIAIPAGLVNQPTSEPTVFTLSRQNPGDIPESGVNTRSPTPSPTRADDYRTFSPTEPGISISPTSDPTQFPTPEPTPVI